MKITKDTLPSLTADDQSFIKIFKEYAERALLGARLIPELSKPRLIEARGSWQNDLDRVGNHEKHLVNGLDHFKQAGHLAFWLRRMSPLIEAHDMTQNFQDAPGYGLTQVEEEYRKVLFAGANEYLAFDFGFQIVKFYETTRVDRATPCPDVRLSADYYKTMCHFMKFKNVSPHAMHLVYKSLYIL